MAIMDCARRLSRSTNYGIRILDSHKPVSEPQISPLFPCLQYMDPQTLLPSLQKPTFVSNPCWFLQLHLPPFVLPWPPEMSAWINNSMKLAVRCSRWRQSMIWTKTMSVPALQWQVCSDRSLNLLLQDWPMFCLWHSTHIIQCMTMGIFLCVESVLWMTSDYNGDTVGEYNFI